MKVEIKFNMKPIEVLITEEISGKTAKEYLVEIFEFINENSEFIEKVTTQELNHKADIAISETKILEELDKEDYPNEIIKLSKALKLDAKDLCLILKIEKKIHDIFPLAIIPEGNTRTKIQRPAVTILLYQNFIIKKDRNLTSSKIVDLLEDTMIDTGELNKSFKSHPYVDQRGKIYSINARGTTDASKVFQELINQVK